MPQDIEYLEEGDLLELFKNKAQKGWVTPDPELLPSAEDINSSPRGFYPLKDDIFKAFELIAPNKVSYLILGQDPYFDEHRDGNGKMKPDATGIAFLIDPNREDGKPPKSFREFSERGKLFPPWGEYKKKRYEEWVRLIEAKKILLLNAALTVPRRPKEPNPGRKSGEHNKAWHNFMADVVKQVIQKSPSAELFAFGIPARQVICDAMMLAGRYHFANHPARSSKTFNDFWDDKQPGEKLAKLLRS